jgi:hypothetical protein
MKLECHDLPYKHFVFEDFFGKENAAFVTERLQEIKQWTYRVGGTDDMWEHKFTQGAADELSAYLFSAVGPIRTLMEDEFGVELSHAVTDISAHKLMAGQRVAVHSDNPTLGNPTHHFIVNFTPAYAGEMSGYGLICYQKSLEAVHTALQPVADTGFAFEANNHSFHAVSKVLKGPRFTVVYSFWHVGNTTANHTRINSEFTSAMNAYAHEINMQEKDTLYGLEVLATARKFPTSVKRWMQTYSLLRQWGVAEAVAKSGLALCVWNDFVSMNAGTAALNALLEEVLGKNAVNLGENYAQLALVTNPSAPLEELENNLAEVHFAMVITQTPWRFFTVEKWQKEQADYLRCRDFLCRESRQLLDGIYPVTDCSVPAATCDPCLPA